MLTLDDAPVKGEEYQFYLLFDSIKLVSLDEAVKRRDRLLKHDKETWEKESSDIYLITARYDEIRIDGSYVYSDIDKVKVA